MIEVMDPTEWDDRYAAAELVWSATPNAVVAAETADLRPGRALDLASGEGRNALWLAQRGWHVTAVDFSSVASERARRIAEERLGDEASRVTTLTADVLTWAPERAARYDLVLLAYVHLPPEPRTVLLRKVVALLADGGTLLVLGHHLDNLTHGVGGPQDPEVLFAPADVVGDLAGTGLVVERAETLHRPVDVEDQPPPTPGRPPEAAPTRSRDALDAFVRARRPHRQAAPISR